MCCCYRFGKRDPNMERPYDISVNAHLSAVRYLHTMRFLKEIIAFLQHFPQLIDAFQRMKAVSRGELVSIQYQGYGTRFINILCAYTCPALYMYMYVFNTTACLVFHLLFYFQNYEPDRKPRILLEVEIDGPMILIPKHAFSPEIMGGVINKVSLCNKFLYDGDVGTLSQIRRLHKAFQTLSTSYSMGTGTLHGTELRSSSMTNLQADGPPGSNTTR